MFVVCCLVRSDRGTWPPLYISSELTRLPPQPLYPIRPHNLEAQCVTALSEASVADRATGAAGYWGRVVALRDWVGADRRNVLCLAKVKKLLKRIWGVSWTAIQWRPEISKKTASIDLVVDWEPHQFPEGFTIHVFPYPSLPSNTNPELQVAISEPQKPTCTGYTKIMEPNPNISPHRTVRLLFVLSAGYWNMGYDPVAPARRLLGRGSYTYGGRPASEYSSNYTISRRLHGTITSIYVCGTHWKPFPRSRPLPKV